jgi:hypothetical protein
MFKETIMENQEILEFIKSRARQTNRRDSNCMGTAFYLVGEQERDVALNRQESLEKLSELKNSQIPEEGYLVYWGTRDYPVHAGVVFDKSSLKIVHRKKKNNILEFGNIEELTQHFGQPFYKIPRIFG